MATTTQTQTVISPDDFFNIPFFILRSLSPHSVITNLYIFLYLSWSFLLLPGWWLSCCTRDIFSHGDKVKMYIGVLRNIVFLWSGKIRDSRRPETSFAWHQNTYFKTHKTRTVPGKLGLMEFLHMSEHNRDIKSNLFKLPSGLIKILGAVHFWT